MKRNDFFVMRASTAESRPDKWKFHRVQIEVGILWCEILFASI